MINNNNKYGSELTGTNLVFEAIIHKGKSSNIYRCHRNDSPNISICVKCRQIGTSEDSVEKELKLLQKLKDITPPLYSYVRTSDHNLIVMEELGYSLHDHFENLGKKFSLNTIALIGLNLLKIMEELHNEGYIHGHLSPRRIVTDKNPAKNNLYFVGLSHVKKYRNEKGEHIRFKENHHTHLTTSAFASINAHMGTRLSRRDDIESLAYILLYFDTKGEIFDKTKQTDLVKWKTTTQPEMMHNKASIEFVQILNYARNLKYDEKPNYEKVEKVLKNVLSKGAGKGNPQYDWSTKQVQNISQKQALEKRNTLRNLLEEQQQADSPMADIFIKGNRFPTIMEESSEQIVSMADFKTDFLEATNIQVVDFSQSPQLNGVYNELKETPKLDSLQQPTLKNRVMKVPFEPDIYSSPQIQSSPWNCSEGIGDDRESIPDKLKSLEFKTAMGIN